MHIYEYVMILNNINYCWGMGICYRESQLVFSRFVWHIYCTRNQNLYPYMSSAYSVKHDVPLWNELIPRALQFTLLRPIHIYTQHSASGTQHGSFQFIIPWKYEYRSMKSCLRMINYIVQNKNLKFVQLSIFIRASCCVLRLSMNRTMGIHSFNFSFVLRAACKYVNYLINP